MIHTSLNDFPSKEKRKATVPFPYAEAFHLFYNFSQFTRILNYWTRVFYRFIHIHFFSRHLRTRPLSLLCIISSEQWSREINRFGDPKTGAIFIPCRADVSWTNGGISLSRGRKVEAGQKLVMFLASSKNRLKCWTRLRASRTWSPGSREWFT